MSTFYVMKIMLNEINYKVNSHHNTYTIYYEHVKENVFKQKFDSR